MTANVYLNFGGNTEDAFTFYRSVFGGEFLGVVRYRDFPENGMNVPEDELDHVAHIALPLGSGLLMGTDVPGSRREAFVVGNNVYIHLEADSGADAGRLFDALASDGHVQMPLMATEWAERYGICTDRFGVQWMVSYTGAVRFSPAPTA